MPSTTFRSSTSLPDGADLLDFDDDLPVRARTNKEKEAPMDELRAANMAHIFGAEGAIADLLEGYESRPSQIAMAEAIQEAILTKRHALIEAPTGTGKSIGYLIPALLSGKTVVIATANKSLQHQLFTKDIPFASEALGLDIDAVLVKGRSNYLCAHKFDEVLSGFRQMAFGDREDKQIAAIKLWDSESETGDVDDLPFVMEGDLRPRVVSFADDCLQQMCQHWADNCWVNKMRDRAAEAQVIVTNHHLLLNALQFGPAGERILPPASIYIVDEAHGLEQTATAVYETILTNHSVDQALARTILKEICDEDELEAIKFHATLAFQEVQLLSDESSFAIEPELEEMKKLGRSLADLAKQVKEQLPKDEALKQLDEEGARRAKSIELAAELISSTAIKVTQLAVPKKDGSVVRYAVRVFDRKRVSLELHAAPIDPAGLLKHYLFAPERNQEALDRTVICTSATLSTAGSFVHFKARCGIETPCVERVLAPVFDYPKQALLYQPALPAFQYQNSSGYYDSVASELDRLLEVSRGRALCLFTNWSGLQQVHERMKNGDRSLIWPIRAQGDAPRDALLRWFRETPWSVLLATRSFWEGVDIPGDGLSLVVLDKLPFPTPGDPLHAARMKELEEGGSSSFGEYMLPLMTLTLKQGFGRLIRRTSDTGVVAILDERLTSKEYGRRSRNDLPPARFSRDFKDVHRFYQGSLNSQAEFGVNVWGWEDDDTVPARIRWRWQLVRLMDGKASSEEGVLSHPEPGGKLIKHAEGDVSESPTAEEAEIHALTAALAELERRVAAGKRSSSEFGIEVRATPSALALLAEGEESTPAPRTVTALRSAVALLAKWKNPALIGVELDAIE
jgi:ATP-dependent DNA helicase DinG